MMATTHAVVGATIMKAVPDPLIGGMLIITSHYLMDLIPHWDFGTDWTKRSVAQTGMFAIADTLFGYAIAFLLFHSSLSPFAILFAVSLSNLPDWIEAPYFILLASKEGHHKAKGGSVGLWLGKIHEFQETYIHTRAGFAQGVLTQIATVIFFLILLGRR